MEKLQTLLTELIDEAFRERVLFVVSTILIGLTANIIAGAIMRFFLRW